MSGFSLGRSKNLTLRLLTHQFREHRPGTDDVTVPFTLRNLKEDQEDVRWRRIKSSPRDRLRA